MAKVVAVGGVFFKAQDTKALAEWYRERLHVELQSWGGAQFQYDRCDRPGQSDDDP